MFRSTHKPGLLHKLKMSTYLRVLAGFYFLGFMLHVFDIFGARLNFSAMTPLWQAWITYLLVFDFFAAITLWKWPKIGVVLFHIIALSQLYAYIAHQDIFGSQEILIVFHVVTLVLYWKLFAREKKAQLAPPP